MQIMSLDGIITLVTENVTEYNIISLLNPEARETAEQIFSHYRENYKSQHIEYFHDISLPVTGLQMPEKEQIRRIINYAGNHKVDIVNCHYGCCRSSAVAYVVRCIEMPPEQAMAIIDPHIHLPNRRIVKLGAEILGISDMLSVCDKYIYGRNK